MLNRFRLLLLFTIVAIGVVGSANAQQAKRQFEKWDKDGDGKLVKDELPQNFRKNFDRVDADKDGVIVLEEHQNFLKQRRNRNRNKKPNQKQVKLPDGIDRVHKDVAYVKDPHQRQNLDLYLPKSDKAPDALIVWIHGGAWKAGDKNRCPALKLVAKGFAVASINYRLSQDAIFPAQIEDCKAAIRWLRENASTYEIDPDRIGVWGSSAGGHLVALLGTSGDVKELAGGEEKTSSRVQAVCDFYGPTTMVKMNEQSTADSKIDHDAKNSPEARLLGGPLQENADKAAAADPITYITEDDPPFLIVHGNKDRLVPWQQSELLNAALSKANVTCELIIVDGGGHGGFLDAKMHDKVKSFFEKSLGGQ